MRIAVEEFTRTIATVSKQSPADRCRAAGLTPDQSDVLGMLARGLSNCQIATQRHIAPGTVVNHNQEIYRKLGLKGNHRAEASRVKAALFYWGIQPEAVAP